MSVQMEWPMSGCTYPPEPKNWIDENFEEKSKFCQNQKF